MKKILLFLCALVCSVAMSAKTIYLNASMWDKDGASFKENVSGKAMTAVAGMGAYYQVELDETQTTVHFQRIGNNSVWNEVAVQNIPVDKNLFTITDWGAGTWSTYDPSVVITYIDITIRVKAATAPTIWWWNAGSKCPNAENVEKEPGVKYTWKDQPVMTAVEGKTGWFEWILKDVNSETGVKFKINSGDKEITAKESTCYDASGSVIDCDNDDPVVTYEYYIAGNKALTGKNWVVDGTGMNKVDGIYTYTFSNVAANTQCELKVTDGTWDNQWGYDQLSTVPAGVTKGTGMGDNNIIFTLAEAGDVTVQFDATETKITLIGTFNGGDEPHDPVIALVGDMNKWNTTDCLFVLSDDKATATASVTLAAATTYGFKILLDGKWYSNDNSGEMTETNCTNWLFVEKDGYDTETKITTVKEGSYKFTWNVANKTLSVTYPGVETSISSTEAEVVTIKVIRDGQVLIIRDGVVYNMMGQGIR